MDSHISQNDGMPTSPNRDVPAEVPVLIVGGGPVGLATSILLAHHGIHSLLVEQHPGTSIYPKARFINTRTMEIFRQCNLQQAVLEGALPPAKCRNAVWVRTLAGEEFACRPIETVLPEAVEAWSPTFGCTMTQEILEPVLLTHARKLAPVQIRFDTQLTSFSQLDDCVTATLLHRPSGRTRQVRAQFLIAADGARSQVRETLGISRIGPNLYSNIMNILFEADLNRWAKDRSINVCMIMNPEASGVLLALDGAKRWSFQAFYFPHQGQRAEDFTPEHCIQVIHKAIGDPTLPVHIIQALPWNALAQVAEAFADRRVFLVGDAAHEMPPAGGFGMNCGIQDAHNLAWKLAAVIKGWADPDLLGTYDVERRPVARWITEQTLLNLASLRRVSSNDAGTTSSDEAVSAALERSEFFREHGMVFGATYESTAIVLDGTLAPHVENPVADYIPNADPGSRAPHVWLEHEGHQRSILDLFGTEFVLLTGEGGESWRIVAVEIADELGVPLKVYMIGGRSELQCSQGTWLSIYGIQNNGAVLIRPDGHVAWRCRTNSDEPADQLIKAMRTILRP